MPISRITPPLDYLQAASRASLQSFELSRLNHAANLRQEIAALMDQWIQETSEALLARWMLDHRKSPETPALPTHDVVRALMDSPTTLFQDSQFPTPQIPPAPPQFARPRALKTTFGRKQKPKQSAAS